MKLRHIVLIGLLLVGGYVVVHWLFGHGGMASVKGNVGQFGVSGSAGIG